MARRPSRGLTDGELRLMRVLWDRGSSTVVDLQRRLGEHLAESTIRTLLGILVDKGYVRRRKDGRAFVYEAAREKGATRRREVLDVVDRFFGTPGDLVLNIVRSEGLAPDEAAQLRAWLDEKDVDSGKGREG